MNFKSKFLDKLASKWSGQQERAQALKRLAENKDWVSLAKKCHDKISAEYKFWISKKLGNRDAKLDDITRDVAFMNTIEAKDTITPQQLARLREIKQKYGVD